MKKVQHWLLGLLCITCSMTCWSIWLPIGVRFYIFDFVALLFIGSALFLFLMGSQPVWLDPVLRKFALWAWAYVGVAALSAVIIFLNPLGTRAWELFAKNFSSLVVYTMVQSLVLLLMARLTPPARDRMYSLYVGMIIFSCLFMFCEVALASRDFDLIRFIFDPISIAAPQADEARTGYYQWDVFFRGNGFASTNTQASYIIPSIPLLLSAVIIRKRLRDYVCLVIVVLGLLVTMSRGGVLGTLVALLVFFGLNWRRSFGVGIALMFLAVPLFYVYSAYTEEIISLATSRGPIDSERLNMYADALAIFAKNPAGIGFGQYGVLFSESDATFWRDANLHNNFLQIFLETGFLGLISRLGLYFYVVWTLIRIGSEEARAAAAGISGLLAAGFFSSVLTTFQAILCIAFLFVWGVQSRRQGEAARARSPAPRPSRSHAPSGRLAGEFGNLPRPVR